MKHSLGISDIRTKYPLSFLVKVNHIAGAPHEIQNFVDTNSLRQYHLLGLCQFLQKSTEVMLF